MDFGSLLGGVKDSMGGMGGGSNGSISLGQIKIKFPSLPKPSNAPITINTPSP